MLSHTLVPQVHAQAPAPPVEPPSTLDAKVTFHYGEGVKAADLNQWGKARESFLSAWQLRQHHQIAANLGRAELKLGMYRDAAVHLAYVRREAKDVADEDRRQAQALFDEARAKVAAITIEVDAPEADVFIDGTKVGRAPVGEPVFVAEMRRAGRDTDGTDVGHRISCLSGPDMGSKMLERQGLRLDTESGRQWEHVRNQAW